MKEKEEIIVTGHKNPDTDSICSAIGYANLKNKINQDSNKIYVPKRAGAINAETQYVLDYFKVGIPGYIEDVRTQIKDTKISSIEGAKETISLKKAWERMREGKMNTLPLMHGKKVIGVITVGDIANSDMNVYDDRIVSKAKTPYQNIVETLDGKLVLDNGKTIFEKGKVLIGAADVEVMCDYIEKGDMAILGDREESQICAIEKGATIMIACNNAHVSENVLELAKQYGCAIITCPHGTYTATRLINQSMPAGYFMTTEGLVKFTITDFIEEIKETMGKLRFHAFPVIDGEGRYQGMISRRNLINLKRKQVILVDHNEKEQAVQGITDCEILEIIDHHKLGNIQTIAPVYFRNQPVGCTATIVYQMYQESGVRMEQEIAGLLTSAILSDTLMFRSPTCTNLDRDAAMKMAQIAGIDNVEEYARQMFTAGSNLKGKSTEEIFYQDYKRFTEGDITFGVGQISSMNEEELASLKQRILPYMKKIKEEQNLTMVLFMLTNILTETTELIFVGERAKGILKDAFNVAVDMNCVVLKDVVSRKKQLIPNMMAAMQQ